MGYSFVPNNVINTVKRTAKVTIAGIAIAIAAIAAPIEPDLSKVTISDPLEKIIAKYVPTSKTPSLQLTEMHALGIRTGKLEISIAKHGKPEMDDKALAMWKDLLPDSAKIPFENVFAQYDAESESFFLAFDFKNGHNLEATTYVDEEDEYVYFSVISAGKVFFQNSLPRDVFFKQAKSTWQQFTENDA